MDDILTHLWILLSVDTGVEYSSIHHDPVIHKYHKEKSFLRNTSHMLSFFSV